MFKQYLSFSHLALLFVPCLYSLSVYAQTEGQYEIVCIEGTSEEEYQCPEGVTEDMCNVMKVSNSTLQKSTGCEKFLIKETEVPEEALALTSEEEQPEAVDVGLEETDNQISIMELDPLTMMLLMSLNMESLGVVTLGDSDIFSDMPLIGSETADTSDMFPEPYDPCLSYFTIDRCIAEFGSAALGLTAGDYGTLSGFGEEGGGGTEVGDVDEVEELSEDLEGESSSDWMDEDIIGGGSSWLEDLLDIISIVLDIYDAIGDFSNGDWSDFGGETGSMLNQPISDMIIDIEGLGGIDAGSILSGDADSFSEMLGILGNEMGSYEVGAIADSLVNSMQEGGIEGFIQQLSQGDFEAWGAVTGVAGLFTGNEQMQDLSWTLNNLGDGSVADMFSGNMTSAESTGAILALGGATTGNYELMDLGLTMDAYTDQIRYNEEVFTNGGLSGEGIYTGDNFQNFAQGQGTGDIKLANYGYDGDFTSDYNSNVLGIGNRDNKLIPEQSAAISQSLANKLGLQAGAVVQITDSNGQSRLVTYSDTVPSSYNGQPLPETIDIYRPSNGSNSWGGNINMSNIQLVRQGDNSLRGDALTQFSRDNYNAARGEFGSTTTSSSIGSAANDLALPQGGGTVPGDDGYNNPLLPPIT